jgi:hypothetical protein
MTRTRFALTLVVSAMLLGLCAAVIAVSLKSDNTTSVAQTSNVAPPSVELPLIDLEGKWVGDSGTGSGSRFEATVANGMISIDLVSDHMTMSYWNGTFANAATNGNKLTSEKVDAGHMVLSAANSKDFLVLDNGLEFEFQAMGMTKKVTLVRG